MTARSASTLDWCGGWWPGRSWPTSGRGDRQRARRDRGRVHDRGGGAAVRGEQVEDGLQLFDGVQVYFDEIAALAGDPLALGDGRHLAGDPGDQPQAAAGRADPDDGE